MSNVELVIPVYNEEGILKQSICTLQAWCAGQPEYSWNIVIANNASTDRTLEIAHQLADKSPDQVSVHDIGIKGRGIALKTVWLNTSADIVAYMDVDLSTDIGHIRELVDPIAAGKADVTYGSRLHRNARTTRSFRREFISRSYVLILRLLAGLKVTDAQCGFKAMSRNAAVRLLPEVLDTQWFFDSELLIIAQHNGVPMEEVPVQWTEDTDSRVNIIKTAVEDLSGIWRLRKNGIPKLKNGDQDI